MIFLYNGDLQLDGYLTAFLKRDNKHGKIVALTYDVSDREKCPLVIDYCAFQVANIVALRSDVDRKLPCMAIIVIYKLVHLFRF